MVTEGSFVTPPCCVKNEDLGMDRRGMRAPSRVVTVGTPPPTGRAPSRHFEHRGHAPTSAAVLHELRPEGAAAP